MMKAIAQIEQLFAVPELEALTGSNRPSVDPAALIMSTFQHNYDARQGAQVVAKSAGLIGEQSPEYMRESREEALRIRLSLIERDNLIRLCKAVLGAELHVEALADSPAIYQDKIGYLGLATGRVQFDFPVKKFLAGNGLDDFTLHGGSRIFPKIYDITPLDGQGEPIVALTTLSA